MDFNNIADPSCLSFTKGTVIEVLEQNMNGNWKGRVKVDGISTRAGYFPSAYVQPLQQMYHQHSPVQQHNSSNIAGISLI